MRISDWSSDVCSSDLQRRQFRVLELRRQVAWIGVGRIDDLLKRRVHPRMEVRADTTGALIEEGLEDRNRGRRGRDRIVDDVGGNDVVAREDLLRRALRRNGADAGVDRKSTRLNSSH